MSIPHPLEMNTKGAEVRRKPKNSTNSRCAIGDETAEHLCENGLLGEEERFKQARKVLDEKYHITDRGLDLVAVITDSPPLRRQFRAICHSG